MSFPDIVVPANQRYVRFARFDDFTDGNDDLDLVIYRQVGVNWVLVRLGRRRSARRAAQAAFVKLKNDVDVEPSAVRRPWSARKE